MLKEAFVSARAGPQGDEVKKMRLSKLWVVSCCLLTVGCLNKDGAEDNLVGTGQAQPVASAVKLSDDEFSGLTPLQQYQVANKLAATLYKGVPADEFFDLGRGIDNLKVDGGKNYLSKTREKLTERLSGEKLEFFRKAIKTRHEFNGNITREIAAKPLATIREFPISRDLFEAWMAYTLTNTILFSPAEEIDSADYVDVQRIYGGLVNAMSQDVSIRDIILTHQKSQANWRRFRSPEDNTREMIEIYLGLFDRDEDVPKASIACKNWYLTDDAEGYQLIIDYSNANTDPQLVLDQWVTSCEDFYELIASHSLVIPRITTFLVDRFFPNASADQRANVVQDIVAANPVRFQDIFLAIIFSKEYLLQNEKAKSFEETFFNLAERTQWESETRFMRDLVNTDLGVTQPTLSKMGQPAMRLKLGRFRDQPLDSLSFATYHSAVRDRLLAKTVNSWGAWDNRFTSIGDFFELDEYIHYLFISVAARKATDQEIQALTGVIEAEGETGKTNQTRIVLDYLSRLPEIYFYNAMN